MTSEAVSQALDNLATAAAKPDQSWAANIMSPTLALAEAGGTTGEWATCLREVFGEYRGPTGVQGAIGATLQSTAASASLRSLSERVRREPSGPPRLLVAKPGLDGHSNGAEQIAVAARDGGMEVIYEGIRVTPSRIAGIARDEDIDIVGLSILSGSHLELVPETVRALRAEGVEAPVVVGGIIPAADQQPLLDAGVTRIFTPKHYKLTDIVTTMVDLALEHRSRQLSHRRTSQPLLHFSRVGCRRWINRTAQSNAPILASRCKGTRSVARPIVSTRTALPGIAAGVLGLAAGMIGLGLDAPSFGAVAGVSSPWPPVWPDSV